MHNIRRTASAVFCCALSVCVAAAASAQNLDIYTDSLLNGWQNFSYGNPVDSDFNNPNPFHNGAPSIAYTPNASFNAVSFARNAQPVNIAQYPVLHFWIHGGVAGGQQLEIFLGLGAAEVIQASGSLNPYVNGGIVGGQWHEVTVTLNTLTPANPPWNGTFDRIDIQTATGAQAVLYMDDFTLQPPGGQPANAMTVEHDVTVSSMVSDRITWRDANNQPRKVSIAHDNVGVFNPDANAQVYGMAMREYQFEMPNNGGTRIAGVTGYGNGGFGGFGYVVNHSSRYAGCAGDDSPLGDYTQITGYQRIFEGPHHAIVRITQNYPRNCPTTLPVEQYRIPVTIDWLFMTGRDNPLWAITYDVDDAFRVSDNAIAPADTFYDDSRAPYGELAIDGNGFTDIDGITWGDRYRFTASGAPLTVNSPWDWTVANSVPFVKVWINGTNAEMGIVQTQTNLQQDAGGARDPGIGSDIRPFWTHVSGDFGNACANPPHVMPCANDWPYQAIGNSLECCGGNTNNARMTWKTQYGFIGQNSYDVNGDVGEPATAPGYPKKSYSTYVVLGAHTTNPTDAIRTQVETMQSVVLSAAIGSVVISGPAGNVRADNVNYQPTGYNHVYGALAFNAAGNALDANVNVGAGTLSKPLLILGNYNGANPSVKYQGGLLVPDTDFYASLRPAANQLWLTVNRDLAGPNNHIEISSCGALAAGITTPSSVAIGAVGITASVPNNAGSTYSWTVTGGTITGGQGTSSIQYDAGSPGTRMTVSVVETTAVGCFSAIKHVMVDFLDVPPSHIFHDFIIKLANNGVTAGCGGGNYCVNDSVLRSQMAVFLLRGEHGESYAPPAAVGVFADVPVPSFFADFIERLYNEGITGGCATNPLRYCPGNAVLRSQMAIFLLRAEHGAGYVPPAAVGIFNDVPPGSFAADFIERLFNEGITGGCSTNPPLYCPNSATTRGAMAVFLVRTFNLQ